MTNHTPGPWIHDDTWGLIRHGDTEICALHSGIAANARLIAAAPELLEIIKAFVNIPIDLSAPNSLERAELRKRGRQAIAKAEGK